MGGEKTLTRSKEPLKKGSPPHGRGKDNIIHAGNGGRGITPAWAGKRRQFWQRFLHGLDHPRMGGEKMRHMARNKNSKGSPPHGRGKENGVRVFKHLTRITPAWAGKSHAVHSPSHGAGDHPRMGGEKAGKERHHNPIRGSPPHGRGKVSFLYASPFCGGITPAWAGKRRSSISKSSSPEDHPRMGGEKSVCQLRASCSQGSPPHGRGKAQAHHE